MTVQELIDRLSEVNDKLKDVKLSLQIENDYSHERDVKDVKEQPSSVTLYNW